MGRRATYRETAELRRRVRELEGVVHALAFGAGEEIARGTICLRGATAIGTARQLRHIVVVRPVYGEDLDQVRAIAFRIPEGI